MNFLHTGQFFGKTNETIHLRGITITDTEYTHPRVDWHFHENAYFTFVLQGALIEGSKKETRTCSNGSLLFHSCQEPHYNIKPDVYTRGFHIELARDCFADCSFDLNELQGSFSVDNLDIKFLFYKIFRESKILDDLAGTSIQMLLLDVLSRMRVSRQSALSTRPAWVGKLKEILSDTFAEKLSLLELSRELNIHPAHLSRDFSKHFCGTFGEYVRKIRIERALTLLPDAGLSLTEIAYRCGFADQSHFIRCFKQINQINPSRYRKLLHGGGRV
jgi:AraC family transcriptional regulator